MNLEARVFVDRIALAAARGLRSCGPAPPALTDETVRQVDGNADLVAMFIEQARGVGASAELVAPGDRAAWVCRSVGPGAVLVDNSIAGAPEIAGAIGTRARVAVGRVGDDALFGAAAVVVWAQAGVAETGSVVFASTAGRMRGLTLVPPRLVVLLDAASIVADLVDLFVRWSPPQALPGGRDQGGAQGDTRLSLHGNVNIVTGPSKTADIEGVPITGVHGPGEVRIGVIDA